MAALVFASVQFRRQSFTITQGIRLYFSPLFWQKFLYAYGVLLRENSIYMLYCGSCADSVKICLVSSASSTGERLKSGDAVRIAPPLAVCLSTKYNELNTAGNAPEVLQKIKNLKNQIKPRYKSADLVILPY